MHWRMQVLTAAGGARETLTPADAIASLDSFSVSSGGSSQEASWQALPGAVNVQPRDIVTLQTSDDNITWTNRFRGVIVQAGNPRSSDLQSYRAVGLKQRFYEMPLTIPRVLGADVGTMVRAVLGGITLPTGVTYDSANVPLLDFTQGDRYPQLESVGDFLDALAASVGRFIVPTGYGGYAYDGVTYADGSTVPAVTWGVDASGAFFFRRPQASVVPLSEWSTGVHVAWTEANAEDACDRVMLVYATEYAPDGFTQDIVVGQSDPSPLANPFIPQPIFKVYGSGSMNATRVELVEDPLLYMRNAPTYASSVPTSGHNITNRANAYDGDSGTYATFTDVLGAPSDALHVRGAGGFILVLDVRLNSAVMTGVPNTNVVIEFSYGLRYHVPPVPTTGRVLLIAPFPAPANMTALSEYSAYVSGGNGVRMYRLMVYSPDDSTSGLLAQALARPVSDAVAVVEHYAMSPVTQTLTLTPITGSALSLDVERVEYAITTTEGVVTRYHIGQEFESDLESQRIVLERLAVRAVRDAPDLPRGKRAKP